MSKSLEELLLGAENQAAASKAVRLAVERAAAAGLPPAYQSNPHDPTEQVIESDRALRRSAGLPDDVD
jgi:hypothetical protein